jgi:acyl dehydratase
MTHINIAGLEVGQEIGSHTFHFTRDSLVRYAGASGDFNPIHYRDDFASRPLYRSNIRGGASRPV